MHLLAAAATVLWFVLAGLLWYARPGDVLWFWASVALGAVWFGGFFWYVTRPK
jgi:hypothetical protein